MATEQLFGKDERVSVPPGIPLIVPFEPPSTDLAAGVHDCIRHPIASQFLYDSLIVLIEACKRERIKNYEAIRAYQVAGHSKRGPPFNDEWDGIDRPELYKPSASSSAQE
mmetsp:Transcript_14388/g.25454  ORF Transcript_14388/g.25454 Transcript_14388/m.25454 type:complete len:110 (+) Transcript_14388:78-407(+)